MDCRVTLAPELGLTAFDFIITWNGLEDCQKVARARTSPATPLRFDVNSVTGNTVVLSGGSKNCISQESLDALIRHVLQKRNIRQEVEFIHRPLPDGGREVVVKSV
ncbi:MAG: hypothetical protein U0Q18_21240 [Bryobacteraceae bacterium]